MDKLKTIFLSLALGATAFSFFACSGDTAPKQESEAQSEEISADAPIELGQPVNGKEEDFLKAVNEAIVLKNGISRYDLTVQLKVDGALVSTQAQMFIEKEKGEIARYYVNNAATQTQAYTDGDYVYAEVEGEKLRMDKNAFDMPSYIVDLEETYAQTEIEKITAYKKGYTFQYVIEFTESYVYEQLEELMDGSTGAIPTDCNSTFVLSSSSAMEKLTIDFLYAGKACSVTATRQITSNVNYTFPDFSKYQESYPTHLAVEELFTAIASSQSETSYTKTLSSGAPYFTYTLYQSNGKKEAAAKRSALAPFYYKDGVTYKESKYDYFNKALTLNPAPYESFFEEATEEVSYAGILGFDLGLNDNHIDFVIKKETDGKTVYQCFLNERGDTRIESALDCRDIEKGKVVYTVEGGNITEIAIACREESSTFALSLSVDFSKNPNLFDGVDFSAYRILVDESNALTDVKATVRSAYDFENYFVNYQTGDIFLKNGKQLYRLDKNHNLLNTYTLLLDYGYTFFGGVLGADSYNLYYAAYYGYSTSSDSKVYCLNLSSGEISESGYGQSYSYYPVAVVFGTVYYQDRDGYLFTKYFGSNEKNVLKMNGASDIYFEKYLTQSRAFLVSGYDYESNYFLGLYDLDTQTLYKEYDLPHLSDDSSLLGGNTCGDGFFDEDEFRWYTSIGQTVATPQYLSVLDQHPDKHYSTDELASWQIVKETEKYLFTTYCVYEKATGKILYFPQKAAYLLFDGGIHVWAYEVDTSETERTLYSFYF